MIIGTKLALFIGGTLFGSAGFKLLSSKDARKVYTHVTAAALRCKDQVMKDVELIQDGCSDILADAKQLNSERAAAQFIDDPAQYELPDGIAGQLKMRTFRSSFFYSASFSASTMSIFRFFLATIHPTSRETPNVSSTETA